MRWIMAAALLLTLVACGTSTDELATWLKNDMQSHVNEDPRFSRYHIVIGDVTLVEEQGNTYRGMVEAQPLRGPAKQVPVTVTFDGDQGVWQTPPGAWAWLPPLPNAEAANGR